MVCDVKCISCIGYQILVISKNQRCVYSITCDFPDNMLRKYVSKIYVETHLLSHCGTWPHYNDVIMGAMACQITSLNIVYSTVYSDADQRKHESSASLAFVWRIHRSPVNSPHKGPVTRKMFPFDDVIMKLGLCGGLHKPITLSNSLRPSDTYMRQ